MPQQRDLGGRIYRDLADGLIADISSGISRSGEGLWSGADIDLQAIT